MVVLCTVLTSSWRVKTLLSPIKNTIRVLGNMVDVEEVVLGNGRAVVRVRFPRDGTAVRKMKFLISLPVSTMFEARHFVCRDFSKVRLPVVV